MADRQRQQQHRAAAASSSSTVTLHQTHTVLWICCDSAGVQQTPAGRPGRPGSDARNAVPPYAHQTHTIRGFDRMRKYYGALSARSVLF